MTKAKAKEAAAGCYVRPDPENTRTTALYNAANSIGEGEGIVMMDFFTTMGPWMLKYMEISATELSPALKEEIKTFATERYNEFAANATAEQQTLFWDMIAKIRNPLDAEFRNNHMGKMKASFTAADANQDGLLDQDENRVWYEGIRKQRSEDGFYVDAESQADAFYA